MGDFVCISSVGALQVQVHVKFKFLAAFHYFTR
jgi:hypothetical protein